MRKYRFNCFDVFIILTTLALICAIIFTVSSFQGSSQAFDAEYTLVVENAPSFVSEAFSTGDILYGEQGAQIGTVSDISVTADDFGAQTVSLLVTSTAYDNGDELTVGRTSVAVGKKMTVNTARVTASAICTSIRINEGEVSAE